MPRLGYLNPHGNWIPDENKEKLEQPPDWFLAGLYNYDDQLVIIPSRFKREKQPAQYLLCRRRKLTEGLGDVAMLDNKHPDTQMCYAHHVLPIAPLVSISGAAIVFTQPNLQSLLDTLKERDAWAAGGGPDTRNVYKVADEVDLFDEEQERKKDAALTDQFYHMGRDAWRSLQARMGWRNKRASDYHGVAKPSSEQRVMLTDAPLIP